MWWAVAVVVLGAAVAWRMRVARRRATVPGGAPVVVVAQDVSRRLQRRSGQGMP